MATIKRVITAKYEIPDPAHFGIMTADVIAHELAKTVDEVLGDLHAATGVVMVTEVTSGCRVRRFEVVV